MIQTNEESSSTCQFGESFRLRYIFFPEPFVVILSPCEAF